MILVTVGTQLPFDRLIRTVDEWAVDKGLDIFAQVGDGQYRPLHISWERSLPPDDFRQRLLRADLVVAHAGMGSILTALEHGKPIVVLPRRAALHEHRNDHQVATTEHFRNGGPVRVAMDEHELVQELDRLNSASPLPPIAATASGQLLEALRAFAKT